MYIEYEDFKKVFEDYCHKAEAHDAPWIEKSSWKAIKDFIAANRNEKPDVKITFSQGNGPTWRTNVGTIQEPLIFVIYIPEMLKRDFEQAGVEVEYNKIGTYPSFSSCCTDYMPSMVKDDHNPILSTVLVNESSVRDLIEDQCSTAQGTANGTVILNPTTGSLSYVYDGQLNEITSDE